MLVNSQIAGSSVQQVENLTELDVLLDDGRIEVVHVTYFLRFYGRHISKFGQFATRDNTYLERSSLAKDLEILRYAETSSTGSYLATSRVELQLHDSR